MKKVNGFYIETIKAGARGFRVWKTQRYEKKSVTFKREEIAWFKKFSEAKAFCESQPDGKSN